MQEGGAFFGKNQVRKADTGDRARRARTQDRKGGEVGLAVLATRAEPSVRGGEGGKDGHFGTKMDKMARKWTIWQGSDMWHRHCTIYGEIAIGKELATSDTALLNRKSNSCLRSPRCEHFVRFTSGTPRQQLLQTANNANCLTWVFGIKQDDEARKFRRIYYDTCNVS